MATSSKKAKGKGVASGSTPTKTPTKTPTQPPSYDHTCFVSKQAETDFKRYWNRKGAAIERRIELGCFGGRYKWAVEFQKRGWEKLTQYEGECVVSLCCEFMANTTKVNDIKGNELIESWVRGKKITLTPETFVHYFGLRREPEAQFTYPNLGAPELPVVVAEILKEGETWDGEINCDKKRLKDRYLPLYLFSCHSLLPIKRTANVSLARAQLLWAIGTGKTIDLPLYMFSQFVEESKNMTALGSIPFCCMLTELFSDSRSRIPQEMFRAYQECPIDEVTINRSRAHIKRRRGEGGPQQGEEVVVVEELGSGSGSHGSTHSPSLEDHITASRAWEAATDQRLTHLEERMGKVEDILGKSEERGIRMEEEQERQSSMLREMMNQLARWKPSSDDDD